MNSEHSEDECRGRASELVSLRGSYIFGAIALGLLFLSVTATKISNFDFWWHLKTGEWILEHHAFPTLEPFSRESVRGLWHNGHGLFQLAIAVIHSLFGIQALSLFQIFCGGVLFYLIFYNSKRNVLWFPLFLLSFLCLSRRFMLRPELFTYGFVLAYVLILSRPKKWPILCLPLLQILMTNSHSAFFLGPVILFLKALSSCFSNKVEKERLFSGFYFFVLGLTVLACAVSPFGFEGLLFPLSLIPKVLLQGDVYKKTILEFASSQWLGADWMYLIYFLVLTVFWVSWLREKNIFSSLVVLFFGGLAIQATRNFNLLLFASLPLMGQSHLFSILANRLRPSIKGFLSLGVGLIALQYAYLFSSDKLYYQQNRLERFGLGFNDCVFSKALPEFLKNIHGNTQLFNTMSLGGYLIYQAPHLKVYFDGRLEAYSQEHYLNYLNMVSDLDCFLKESEKRGINLVILNHSIHEGTPLMKLAKIPSWKLVFVDAFVAVFAKDDLIRENPWMSEFNLQKSLDLVELRLRNKDSREKDLERAVLNLALEDMQSQMTV